MRMIYIKNFYHRIKLGVEGISNILRGNFQVFAIRDILLLLAGGLSGGLTMIYVMDVLRADAVAIGLLGSVSAVVGTCFVLIGGWIGDRYNRKKMFLIGTGLNVFNPLIYALAPSWKYLLISSCTASIGNSIASPVGFSIRASSIKRSLLTKATATLYTMHAIINMIIPLLGAALISKAGDLQALRPIYAIQACINLGAWLYTAKKLKVTEIRDKATASDHSRPSLKGFFNEFLETYRISRKEGTWPFLILSATSPWAFSVDGSFQTVYARKICQSPIIVIGLLPTISSIVAMSLYIPTANLAEKRGGMDAVVKIRPLQYLSYVIYISAGTLFIPGITPYVPLVVWGIRRAGGVAGPGWETASIEAMPLERLAKWRALQNFVSQVVGIPAPMIGGLLWTLDPRAPFIWHLCVDSLLRFNIMKRIAKMQAVKRGLKP